MENTPPTNELIERLVERLSPEGRTALEELDILGAGLAETESEESMAPEMERHLEGVMDRVNALSDEEQQIIAQILQLSARAHESRAEEYADDARHAMLAVSVIERVQELERVEGREPSASMTLLEALAVLERHGEDAPAIDTERVVEVPQEERRTVPAYYPDFADADIWRAWDDSSQAEAWAKLRDFRDMCIAHSVSELAGMDFRPIDYAGVIAALWGIEKEEAAEIVRQRQGY
jgi:hypothetical protein